MMAARKIKNYNCDGEHCGASDGQVRVYPTGSGSNLILCISCAAHENHFRYLKGVETGKPDDWPQVNWWQCSIYGEDSNDRA